MLNTVVFSILWLFILAVSLYTLLRSADYFVETAENLGKKFNIPSFIVGATVVAFGTSLPELAVGIVSILKDEANIITGTAIGSNISNILFIIGVGIALSSSFKINFMKQKVEFTLLFFITALISYFLWDKRFDTFEAIVSVVLLVAYLVYVVKFSTSEDEEDDEEIVRFDTVRIALFIASIFGIWLGAKFTTDAIVNISNRLNLGSDVIAQTVVALGTSLPELAVTVSAARKNQFGIVLGNVIGSNIFNLLAVIAIPALVGTATGHLFIISDMTFNQFSIPMMVFATVLLIALSLLKQTPRFFGYLFIALYVFFLIGSFFKINLLLW